MSEVYEFEDEVGSMPPLVFSDYSNKVYGKHLNSYGEEGARKTRSAAQKVLSDSLAQEKDPSKNNNVLLVGKVQSGKTSNLEALVGLALDNGFNLIVMYGGYDNTLLKQTVRRFRKTMDSPKDTDEEDDLWDPSTPNIFTTDSKDELCINNLTADTIRSFLDEGIPVFIITIKDARRIRGVNEKLNDLKDYPIQSLVIDDEGDQASLNNVKDKESDASATYAAICTMKEVLGDPLYFSVTATPQANIFLNSLSVLRPNSVHLLHPARGYCGADFFHREDHGIIYTVPDEMDIARDDNRSPESLQFAVRHFIMASAILFELGKIGYSSDLQGIVELSIQHAELLNFNDRSSTMKLVEGFNKMSVILLRAPDNASFITSSFPVTASWTDEEAENPDWLYLPLSATSALIFHEERQQNFFFRRISAEEVDKLNVYSLEMNALWDTAISGSKTALETCLHSMS